LANQPVKSLLLPVISTPFNLSNPLAGRVNHLNFVRASLSTSVNLEVKSSAVKVIVASSAPAFGISATTGRSFTGVIVIFTSSSTAA
jgi:hypothetical protein